MNNHQVEAGPFQPISPKIKQPEFSPKLDTYSVEFDFTTKVERLPIILNLGKEANLS